jgi:hypothetical protein
MPLDYSLTCDTNASDDHICELVSRCIAVVPVMEEGYLRYRAPGLWGTITSASIISKQLTKETFGFIPTKKFLFRLDKFEGFPSGLDNMIKICVILIRELTGNCVLKYEDVTYLWRRNNQLILKSSQDDSNRLQLLKTLADGIGGPYTFGILPEI